LVIPGYEFLVTGKLPEDRPPGSLEIPDMGGVFPCEPIA
jgi:hypothetical protein